MRKIDKQRGVKGLLLSMIFLMSFGLQLSHAQTSISGTVKSGDDNESLPGVNVILKGTATGTVTDVEGNYNINVPGSESVLVFSSVGYVSEEIVVGSQSVIDITLAADITALSEVIVIGYGTQEKKDVTGAIGSVSSEDFEGQPVIRADQILQGRAAGVSVTNSSGAPGGDVKIRIRGANSINGNNDPLYVIDGFVGGNFNDINPADIEDIQVLKDASSTAIYGSRGSNGVILITTKSGKIGKPKFSFTARYNTSTVLNKWDLMDAGTFAGVANERATALGTTQPFTSQQVADYKANGGTDWQDEIYRTATGQEYQMDYSGGNQDVKYFVSSNVLDQNGIVINSYFKRYSVRTNISANLTKKLDARLKLNFIRRESNNVQGNGNIGSPTGAVTGWAPTTPAYDENGVPTVRDPVSSIKGNPIEGANNDNINETNNFMANAGLVYEFIDGLTLDVGFAGSYSNLQYKGFSKGSISNNPTARRESTEYLFLQNTNTLNYHKTFNAVHDFTATAVFESQMQQTDRFGANASGLQFPGLKYDNITLANGVGTSSYYEKQTIQSLIGRINYQYDNRYLVTASVRRDGSSKFSDDNKYSTFPSVGLGWRISEESFMSSSFFEDLKLRGSWGETGSQGIGVYGTVTSFQTGDQQAATSFLNGTLTPGIIIGNPGNPNLKWETTTQTNVGVDMLMLNGRLGITADYFKKSTTDLLLSEPLPKYAGGGSIFRNVGEVENNGFEFSITSTVIDNTNFSWNTSLNMSFLQNKVVDISDQEVIFVDPNAGAGVTNLPEGVLMPGQPLTAYWGLNYLGTWKTDEADEAAQYGKVPGDSHYEDLNGDNVIGGDDYQIIGTGIPERLFGWNNNLFFHNFTLNVFFQAMGGYDKWNFTYGQAISALADAREITHVDIVNRWTPSNQTEIPAFSSTDVVELQSSRFVEDGSFMRLKNISLKYDFQLGKEKGTNLSLMLAATNILTFTGYKGLDPEAYSNNGGSDNRGADGGSYPNARTYTFGVNLNF
jgi:TonB-linked SusC/RagA family outer membrane protein